MFLSGFGADSEPILSRFEFASESLMSRFRIASNSFQSLLIAVWDPLLTLYRANDFEQIEHIYRLERR